MTIVTCLCFSCTYISVNAADTAAVITSLFNTTIESPGQTKLLIGNYCNAVLSGDSAFIKDNAVYNAQRSSFVYLLCRNAGDTRNSKLGNDTYKFDLDEFSELWITDEYCSPAASMSNDCDLSNVTSKIFNHIMNDYMNMKQPSLYGLNAKYKDDKDLGNLVNEYLTGYFGIAICDNTDHPYDKTCRMARSYVKNVRNILSEVRIFNTDAFLNLPSLSKDEGPCGTGASNIKLNIFYCGLKDTWTTSMASFVNLVYNEIFYYRLFMGYYLIMIQNYPELSPHFVIGDSYSTILKRFSSDYLRSQSALSLSLRMMRDMYVAFPFHVWFSMYQEDLDGFWKELARIAPPIYTLYDKLRNVQKPQ